MHVSVLPAPESPAAFLLFSFDLSHGLFVASCQIGGLGGEKLACIIVK
jgi:hypothetical protein